MGEEYPAAPWRLCVVARAIGIRAAHGHAETPPDSASFSRPPLLRSLPPNIECPFSGHAEVLHSAGSVALHPVGSVALDGGLP
jgi:hypothetical protein